MVEKTEAHTQTAAVEIISEIFRRIKNLESKVDRIEGKIFSLENEIEKVKNDIRVYNDFNRSNIQELSVKIDNLNKTIVSIREELKEYAKEEEVKKLKTLIEIFNPLKSSFVTKDELKSSIEELKKQFKIEK